ncbi:MAG: tetratricopeptide repeat protein [Pseudomonadota bacterium]|nr:tetratricopeptide repeat protein [Pseudomonadota bacterium]
MGKSVLRNPVKWNRYIAVTGVFRSSIDTMINKYLLVVVNLILVGSMLSGAGASAQGLGAVVESQPVGRGSASVNQQAPVNNDALSLLLEQNRQLQAEVQALRGMVEEQGFELRKLQRNSLSRYTDTDDRLRNLETASSQSVVSVAPKRPQVTGGGIITSGTVDQGVPTEASPATITGPETTMVESAAAAQRPASRATLQPAVLSEQQLYQMAYDSVINSNFERSIAEFDQYLSIYPQGRFVTNAFYWKGQAFLYLNRYAEARDSYEVILNEYDNSAKLPDAMYGLGLAYQGLGNIPQARQLLNDIKRRFPNTGVANLADTRLLTLD